MCGRPCAKLLLFVTNFVLFIAGVVLVAFGLIAKFNPQLLTSSLSNTSASPVDVTNLLSSSANFLIVVGFFILIFSFLGCCGGCFEILWMLFLYSAALLAIIVLEIVLIVFILHDPSKVQESTKELMFKSFLEFKPAKLVDDKVVMQNDSISLSWMGIQTSMTCCGVNSTDNYKLLDWDRHYTFNSQSILVERPPSCCLGTKLKVENTEEFVDCLEGKPSGQRIGCLEAVQRTLKSAWRLPVIVCVLVIFVEILSVFCAIYISVTKSRGMPV